MKRKIALILILLGLLSVKDVYCNNSSRLKTLFNSGWKFILDDSIKYRKNNYDDSKWRNIQLPHDWSIEQPFSKSNCGSNAWLPGGKAWYRKRFVIDASDKGKCFNLQFDGIYRHSRVWVNGAFIGVQYNGYTSFNFDITEAINYGGENVIAISVDNSDQPNCRWYSGSGIYRNVWLIKTEKEHIKNWGTYITSSNISSKSADIKITTTINNSDIKNQEIELESVIFDKDKNKISFVTSKLFTNPLQDKEISQKLNVRNPNLWSVDSPYLYTCISKIKINNRVVDKYESTFGIRSIEFNSEKGFFLNGKNLKLKGVCLHHDGGVVGAAVPVQIWERRLAELKRIGCNAIRTSHNPPAPEFLDLCDKMGFLVMEEFEDKWNYLTCEPDYYAAKFADPFFHVEWEKNFRETIRRDRNHPSVIIWSVGNENHEPGSKEENVGLKRYCSFVHNMDNTRPVISGMPRDKDLPVNNIVDGIINSCSFMDVMAMNYGEQWSKTVHDKCSGKPYVSTESYTYFGSTPEKRWANLEYNSWLYVMKNDFNMGLFLWVGVNYLGESRNFGSIGSNSGLLDIAGFQTPRAGLFQAFWSDKPVVHLDIYNGDSDDLSKSGRWGWPSMSRNWNLQKGKQCDLVTYTNCDEVDLYVNNHKIETKELADYPNWIMKWKNIDYIKGTLKAVGKIAGKPVCQDIIKSFGMPYKIDIQQKFKPKFSSNEIEQLEIQLLDKDGNPVINEDRLLHVNVEAGGEILALTNGNLTTSENYIQTKQKTTFNGKMLCIVKRNNKSALKVSIYGDNMKRQSINL